MKNLPTVKQLRYLVALDKHRHFRKAAEACFVTQSAFSTAIKELESLLGTTLVERTNRSVVMTEAGRQTAAQARLCLLDLEGVVDIARQFSSPLEGNLRLGILPTIAPFLLPAFLPALKKDFPGIQLYLREGQSKEILGDLLDGELDAIIAALPLDSDRIEFNPAFKDRFYFACHRDSGHAGRDRILPRLLDPHSVFLLADGHCLRDQTLESCKLRGTDKVNDFEVGSIYTLVQMVGGNLGVTFLPELAVAGGVLDNTAVVATPMSASEHRTVGIATRKSSARREEFERIADVLRSVGKEVLTGYGANRKIKGV